MQNGGKKCDKLAGMREKNWKKHPKSTRFLAARKFSCVVLVIEISELIVNHLRFAV